MGLQLAAISKRFRLMAEQAAKAAANAGKSAEGSVQVGMNFQKMMENMKYAAAENAAVFGTPQPKIFRQRAHTRRRFAGDARPRCRAGGRQGNLP